MCPRNGLIYLGNSESLETGKEKRERKGGSSTRQESKRGDGGGGDWKCCHSQTGVNAT